jgi:hypothetical protein
MVKHNFIEDFANKMLTLEEIIFIGVFGKNTGLFYINGEFTEFTNDNMYLLN